MIDEEERVVLVDANDRELGTEDKLTAHRQGLLHRAVSVFLFDDQGRLLLQQRSADKYHSPLRWSNACCSHPRQGELPATAAQRRLQDELGITCELQSAGVFTYRADVGGGLVEHELDHLFIGRFNGTPSPASQEVGAWRWVSPEELDRDVQEHPEHFTAWFLPAYQALKRLTTT